MAAAITAALIAVVAVACTAFIVSRSTRQAITRAINGRSGADPVDEHRRLMRSAATETAARQETADLLQLSLDALTSGVVVTDNAGNVLVRNRLASEVSTRAHEKSLIDAAVSELLARAARGERSEREIEVYGPPKRTLFLNAVPISRAGEIVGALTVVEDVTDHHRIENTRRDFIANLSHELRTPIGAASLLAEMLVDEDDGDTRRQLTDRLMIETARMTDTIDDLLALSRIESSTETYDEAVVLQEIIADAVARTRVLAETTDIDVGALMPDDPITMRGNHTQLVTALVNLVENAIKYSSAGDSVSLRTRVGEDTVALVVQDTGRGIPAKDLDRVFERFYRVDRSRDAATGGTGIGLSIVRHVALNHGGTVSVESFEGDGSTFTMLLPLTTAADSVSTNEMRSTDGLR